MVEKTFIPNKGDIIKLSLDPRTGHEQSGPRPGLVISNSTFNKATGFAVICPITNTYRNYPFHIPLDKGIPVTGVVMVDQVKSLDYEVRNAKLIACVSVDFITNVLALHSAIFQDDGTT